MTIPERTCCYIDDETGRVCDAPAVWEIWTDAVDDNVDACSAHVEDLLTDAPLHHVYRIADAVAAR